MLASAIAAQPLLCLLAAGAVALLVYSLHPIRRWQLRSIPGPMPAPFIGNLGSIFKLGIHRVWGPWNSKFGYVYKVWWGATPCVVVSEPQAARLILLKNHQRFRLPGTNDLQRGEEAEMNRVGLASATDKDLHRDIKNAWLPLFNSASLEASNALINRCAEHLCSNLAAYAREGRETNIWRDFGRMTMDVVGSVAFGVDFHTQEGDDGENSEAAQRLIGAAQTIFSQSPFFGNMYAAPMVVLPALKPLLKQLNRVYPDPTGRPVREARKLLNDTTVKLLKQARAQQAAGAAVDVAVAAGSAEPKQASAPDQTLPQPRKKSRAVQPGSFLALLMKAQHEKSGEPFSDTAIVAQAFTFLLAGYETTATALGFTLYCLGANPDKAAKLTQEVDNEAPAGNVSAEQLGRMPYTDACLREAMRLFPPAVIVGRELGEAMTVRGHALPKGTGVMVPVAHMHRDPAIYSRPDDFIPERWLEGTPEHAADKYRPGAWLTFGEGMRVCVGQRLALNEAKITLAHVFRRFSFKLSPGQVPLETECPLLLKPKHGVFMTPVLRTEE